MSLLFQVFRYYDYICLFLHSWCPKHLEQVDQNFCPTIADSASKSFEMLVEPYLLLQ